MAKQPEDRSTSDLFAEDIGHTAVFGKSGAGKSTVSFVESVARIRTFRERRKLFPSDQSVACELCGTRHHGPCQRTRWGGK